MANSILNILATGAYQNVTLPNRTQVISLQMRENVDMTYHWVGQAAYWTVKAGTVRTLVGEMWDGQLEVMAAAGNNIEIELGTRWLQALA